MNATAPIRGDTQATIARARAAECAAGGHEELAELAADLSVHIARLLPTARARVDEMWHGSREWYVLSTRLSSISAEAEQPLDTGTLAAHVQVRLRALDCEWLLTRYGADLHAEEPAR
ncbi:DUF6415 family natural product biosynthesis protein [Streptomyces lushanensis]|uniref:DUF6415 family natural product biosynthesis protein n=1 Tax=Streptomyces lushanensis TaxID=1434255 RepID=UPI00083702D0|nr:DUF6415 family natural product biosynthesis protein [Streptomyces lushanensis]